MWSKNEEEWTDEEQSTYKEEWTYKKELIDKEESVNLSHIQPEVKEGKGIKVLTPNKVSTWLPILLAQIKAGNNSYKLKNEIKQILYLLYQHNKITKKVYNNLNKSL